MTFVCATYPKLWKNWTVFGSKFQVNKFSVGRCIKSGVRLRLVNQQCCCLFLLFQDLTCLPHIFLVYIDGKPCIGSDWGLQFFFLCQETKYEINKNMITNNKLCFPPIAFFLVFCLFSPLFDCWNFRNDINCNRGWDSAIILQEDYKTPTHSPPPCSSEVCAPFCWFWDTCKNIQTNFPSSPRWPVKQRQTIWKEKEVGNIHTEKMMKIEQKAAVDLNRELPSVQ